MLKQIRSTEFGMRYAKLLLLPSLEAILEVPRGPHPRRKSSEGSPRAPKTPTSSRETVT